MNRYLIMASVLIMWLPLKSHAGYNDLLEEFGSYSPPAYVQSREDTAPAPEGKTEDEALTDEKAQIASAIDRWEAFLANPDPETVFYRPDPVLLDSIRSAGQNADAAARVVANPFSTETLDALVFVRNPGIRAAENRFRASIESFSQVSALDDILRRYTAFTEGLMTGIGPMKGKDPVSLKFPYPGVFSLKGQIAQQEVQAAWETLEKTRRDTLTSARTAFWSLFYNLKAQKIEAETLDLLEYLEKVATKRYEAGKTSFQDVIKVRIERDILAVKLHTLKEAERNIETKLLELLDLPPKARLGSPKDRPSSRELPALGSLYGLALERRQELRRMRAEIGKMERMIEMIETMIFPPYTLNLSLYEDEALNKVGFSALKEPFPVKTEASKGAGLPKMPWYGSNDAYLRETEQKLLALREGLKENEDVTVTMVRKAWFDLDLAMREEFLYGAKVVSQTEAALDVSVRGYESGNVTFADLISSYKVWLQTRLAIYNKRSDLEIAWAELERTVGVILR